MGRRKLGSLTYQINQRMNALNRIGESKHEAKQRLREACERQGVRWNPSQAEGIYSYKTFDAYKQSAMEFTKWLKQEHSNVKNMQDVQKHHVVAYLQQRQGHGKSAWSVSKDMSALNKVFSMNVTKQEAHLQERSYKQTVRSRVERSHDSKYNPKNYEQQILFAKSFGLRRESILGGQYQVKDVSLFRKDDRIYCSVIEKGGRYREAPCLRSMHSEVEKQFPHIAERESLTKQQFQALYATSNDYLFDRYTNKIDNHAFRHEYARNLYQELQEQRQDAEERLLYRGYDREILQEVSEALGHSRLSVVVEHYLR